ncbi:hypothetical protein D3C72_1348100 [compost metagenome]
MQLAFLLELACQVAVGRAAAAGRSGSAGLVQRLLLLGQERGSTHLIAAVAEFGLQPLRQRDRPAVDARHLAGLIGQRQCRIGQVGRVQVSRSKARPVRAMRAHAGRGGDAGTAAAIARGNVGHGSQAAQLALVGHVQIAPGADIEQAGAGDVEGAEADIAAGLHHRHIIGTGMHDQVAACGGIADCGGPRFGREIVAVGGAHPADRTVGIAEHGAQVVIGAQRRTGVDDVATSADRHRAATVVPGGGGRGDAAVDELVVARIDHAAAAQADQVTVHGVVARRLLAHVHVAGGGGRGEDEQRVQL